MRARRIAPKIDSRSQEIVLLKINLILGQDQALRQSAALTENGLTGRWEVPNEAQTGRAQKMFDQLNIKNITVKVVPYGG